MGNDSQWSESRLHYVDNQLASSRPVTKPWVSQWVYHGGDTVNVPSLPPDVPETEVVALLSSLAMKSVPDRDATDTSASFSEAHWFASDCYWVADTDAERGRPDDFLVPCGVDFVLPDATGEVCDPAVRQETGITSSGGNSSASEGQSTGWGTPDPQDSPFSPLRGDQCWESYIGSEQWSTSRSAVINYWPADYDHESAVASTRTLATWHVDAVCDRDLDQRSRKDGNCTVDSPGSPTPSLKTRTEFSRKFQKGEVGEHCQTCYERQMELQAIDDLETASSKFKPLDYESRNRWFPKSQTVNNYVRIADET